MILSKKLKSLLSKCNTLITYQPLSDEVDVATIPLLKDLFTDVMCLPNDKNSDYLYWANFCRKKYVNKFVCVLVPGQTFDIFGTRHGRGRGWYDRFLSSIPKNWIRIGVAQKSQFSVSKITKEPWDESVDWVIVKNGSTFDIYETKNSKNHQ